jgi:hypothetical protein
MYGWYRLYTNWRKIAKRSTMKQDQFIEDYTDDYQKDIYMDNMDGQAMGPPPEYMPVANQDMEMQRDLPQGGAVEDPMPVMPPVEEAPLPPAPPPVAPYYPQPVAELYTAPPMAVAAPSTFYNSHQVTAPMASSYMPGIQQPGMMMPAVGMPGTMSYRIG